VNFIITFDDLTDLDPFALGLLCDGYDERRRGTFQGSNVEIDRDHRQRE
jgi:hypothetical protein